MLQEHTGIVEDTFATIFSVSGSEWHLKYAVSLRVQQVTLGRTHS